MGGHVCDYDKSGNTIAPRAKINYRVIRSLFDSGLVRVNKKIRTPHLRCVIFEWADDINQYRREILKTKVFNDSYRVTNQLIAATASMYGLKVNFIGARNVFEILHADGSAIPFKLGNQVVNNTYLFMTESGQPVTRLKDMTYIEWEEYLYGVAVRANIKIDPPKASVGHFSIFKKN